MGSPHESAMNHAGRTSDHSFADIRSARHAQNRTRARNNKYYNFKGITRAQLPSSPKQIAHYTPSTCTYHGPCNSHFHVFPADLSTAPVKKFTKREAYNEAQLWPRPPKYHNSKWKKNHYTCCWGSGRTRDPEKEVPLRQHLDDLGWQQLFDEAASSGSRCWFGSCDCFSQEGEWADGGNGPPEEAFLGEYMDAVPVDAFDDVSDWDVLSFTSETWSEIDLFFGG